MYGGFGYRDVAGAHGRLDSLVSVRREEDEDDEEDGRRAYAVEDVTESGQKPPGILTCGSEFMQDFSSLSQTITDHVCYHASVDSRLSVCLVLVQHLLG